MKKTLNKWEKLTFLGLILFLTIGLLKVGVGNVNVQANNTAQTLPFSQNWTNIGLITMNDIWNDVPGIVAFQGNDITTATDADPRTLLADGSTTVLDVIANVANCDTNTSGGIAECETAGGNPTIALQGSGTSDVPHIVLYLNTTGQSNIRVSYNARDVDGSADNSVQQINTQYRVGSTGDFINVDGGYIADATTGPSLATMVTPVAVTLPANANNQPVVEVRIMTTNALGSDEWVGIDDISVTTNTSGTPTPTPSPSPTSTPTPTPTATPSPTPSPSSTPTPVPGVTVIINEADSDTAGADTLEFVELYDGGVGNTSLNGLVVVFYNGSNDMSYAAFDLDGFTTNGSGYFTLGNTLVPGVDLVFADNTLQNGADAVALYAAEATAFPNGTPVTTTNLRDALVYDTSDADDAELLVLLNAGQPQIDENATATSATVSMQRCPNGSGGVRNTSTYAVQSPTADGVNTCADPTPTPSRANVDFNGDGRSDYVITRNENSLLNWWVAITGSTNTSSFQWGLATDIATPADFDGDGRTDFAVWRDEPSNPNKANFYILRSLTNTVQIEQFGRTGDNPRIVGDYDGDGRADAAVYREGVGGGQSFFFYRPSTMPGTDFFPRQFGIAGDKAVPGDYDGDGRYDLCVARNIGGGQNQFIVLQSSNLVDRYFTWGLTTDVIVPGDYDGDRRNDFCVVRTVSGQLLWYILEADGGGTSTAAIFWGLAGDVPTPGDYDGDRSQDVAVWRPSANPDLNIFYVRRSSNSMLQAFKWGLQTDYPTANWLVVR